MAIAMRATAGREPTREQHAELGRLEDKAAQADDNYRDACPNLPANGPLSGVKVDRVNDVDASAKARLRQATRLKDEAHEKLDAYRRKHFARGE